ncbi:MAG: N-acetylmuramoyl-L-alanine amidase [Candidatus Methylumidiphilus sp.]
MAPAPASLFFAAEPAKPAAPAIVAIDAGHGGKDTGAIGQGGTLEKNVALAISRKLERLLRAEPGLRPVLVRKGDTFIGLSQRTAAARRADADLLVSVHADAAANDKAVGSSVYTLQPRGARGNLPARQTLSASNRAARNILGELRRGQPVHHPWVEKARFTVLKSPDLPSVLVETGYISNPVEERKLASPAHQEKVARAICNGVRAYFRAAAPQRKAAKPRHVLMADRR